MNVEQFYKDGYYIGNITFDDEKFNAAYDEILTLSVDKSAHYQYVQSVFGRGDLPHLIDIADMDTRMELITNENLIVTQQWYQMSGYKHSSIVNYFSSVVEDFIFDVYPELNVNNIGHDASISLYENGDFINEHQDGFNQGRLCAILIYLTDIKEYNNGGGELIINNTSVIPVKGTYAIIDFTKNNPFHAVNPVKNNFRRFCFLDFVYNLDKQRKNNV